MVNKVETIDTWEVRDLEDNSIYKIEVENCSELGNKNQPGIRIKYYIGGAGYYCIYEPWTGEKLAYEAKKAGGTLVRKDKSWEKHDDLWLRNSLIRLSVFFEDSISADLATGLLAGNTPS